MTQRTWFGGKVTYLDADAVEVVPPGTVYRCPVCLTPDSGGWLVESLTLAGVADTGATVLHALGMINARLLAVVRAYQDAGEPIPWLETPREVPPGSMRATVFVRLTREQRGIA